MRTPRENVIGLKTARAGLRASARAIRRTIDDLFELHRSLPVAPSESSVEDLDADPDVSTEMRAVIDCVARDLEPAAKALLDAASYRPGRTGAPAHDLSFFQDDAGDAALRQVLRGLRDLRGEE